MADKSLSFSDADRVRCINAINMAIASAERSVKSNTIQSVKDGFLAEVSELQVLKSKFTLTK